jgi:hypothetical protein
MVLVRGGVPGISDSCRGPLQTLPETEVSIAEHPAHLLGILDEHPPFRVCPHSACRRSGDECMPLPCVLRPTGQIGTATAAWSKGVHVPYGRR